MKQANHSIAHTSAQAPAFPPATPRVLRVNLPRSAARELCQKLDGWRRQTGRQLGFSGVLYGDYARLYIDAQGELPRTLISLVLRHVRPCGTLAICGQWLIGLEVVPVLGEAELYEVAL